MEIMSLMDTVSQPFVQKSVELPLLLQSFTAIDSTVFFIQTVKNLGISGIMVDFDMHVRLADEPIIFIEAIGQLDHRGVFTSFSDREV